MHEGKVLRFGVKKTQKIFITGRGFGSVGRAVASDTNEPRFESSHQQTLFTTNCIEAVLQRQKMKKQRLGKAK